MYPCSVIELRFDITDVLSTGGPCRIAGRRDARRIHAGQKVGLRRLLETEAVHREYPFM